MKSIYYCMWINGQRMAHEAYPEKRTDEEPAAKKRLVDAWSKRSGMTAEEIYNNAIFAWQPRGELYA